MAHRPFPTASDSHRSSVAPGRSAAAALPTMALGWAQRPAPSDVLRPLSLGSTDVSAVSALVPLFNRLHRAHRLHPWTADQRHEAVEHIDALSRPVALGALAWLGRWLGDEGDHAGGWGEAAATAVGAWLDWLAYLSVPRGPTERSLPILVADAAPCLIGSDGLLDVPANARPFGADLLVAWTVGVWSGARGRSAGQRSGAVLTWRSGTHTDRNLGALLTSIEPLLACGWSYGVDLMGEADARGLIAMAERWTRAGDGLEMGNVFTNETPYDDARRGACARLRALGERRVLRTATEISPSAPCGAPPRRM